MDRLTQEFLDELLTTQEKLKKMYSELETCVDEHSNWKREHLGINCHYLIGTITDVTINDEELCIETCGYDSIGECFTEFRYRYQLHELVDETWRERALQEYERRHLILLEEQRLRDERLMREAEEKERAEYERLRAKFENS